MQPHWEQIYRSRSEQDVSWFRPHLKTSLTLIESVVLNLGAPVIDIGAGASLTPP